MVSKLKRSLFFPVASYFKFWAGIQLSIWKPRIFVITGSSGKTTLLHLIESQLGKSAKYSHHANSSFGIPFDILDLQRKTLKLTEWPVIFLLAPFRAFKKPFSENLYIVEADCDRPHEGKFLASLLKPEVTMWLDVSKTHTMNFDQEAFQKRKKVEEVIAREFSYFGNYSTQLVMINAEDSLIHQELSRFKSNIYEVRNKMLQTYQITPQKTVFKINGEEYKFNFLLPKETFVSIAMCLELLQYLKHDIDPNFSNFYLPPGRSSIFPGIKNTTIIDSSYNSNFDSMRAILTMYQAYPSKVKWAVISDMIELGKEEAEEHEKLAGIIAQSSLDQIILMGPRITKYTYPVLKEALPKTDIVCFQTPKEVLNYLTSQISGGETILFKGARFLEGVIEHLLANKNDIKNLCRREPVWQKRREVWGL